WVFSRLGTFDSALAQFGLAPGLVWGFVVLTTIVFVMGLYLGLWLSRFRHFFISFSRFVMVGFLNAGIDFGVFNFLMFVANIEVGAAVSAFKGVSFVAAVINSYFWNKFWVFEAGATSKTGSEFSKFIVVTAIGLFINVGVVSGILYVYAPQFGFSQLAWNNVAAVAGAAMGLIWNFVGYRLIVFKKEATAIA
ncbi:MAG: GtrA family protein, partial [bacterium]|nr:GtrA family protein [bacterium]